MSDDALPLCACVQYYDSHHPECPARRAYEALLLKLEAAELREKGLRRKIEITEEYATSRLCPDHRGKWERDRCVMCELGKLDEYEHREKLHMDRCRHDMERIVRLE